MSIKVDNRLCNVTVFFSDMPNLLNWAALITYLLLTTSSASTYPNCTDHSTYTSYGKSTEYKGLRDRTAWDRTLDSGDACDFSAIVPPQQAQTCGDCDFDLEDDTWYRFDQGPYVEIAEYSDNSSCPARGHCNGFYQIALLSSDIDSGNVNSKKYYVVVSDAADPSNRKCIIVNNEKFMVEEYYCDKFRLYRFPSGWKNSSSACSNTKDDQGTVSPTPYSFCMTDTVKKLTLTANRKYFTEDDTLLTCTSEMSPQPPPDMTWKNSDDQDITSQASRDSTLSSLFKEVYSLNSSTLTSVTCQVDDKSHTFYRISSIETENVTGIAGEEVTATCNFTLDEISTEDEEDIYFIEIGDDSEVFYNSLNISSRGDTWKIDKTNPDIFSVSITSVRAKSEEWKCGIRDPVTNVYTTVPFTITVNGCEVGKGFPSDDSGECITCAENTYSSKNHCKDCPTGQVSGKGASRCFEIVAKDVVWTSSKKVNGICSVILSGFSEEIKSNLYMIQEKEGEDVYYTETNITSGYKILVSKIGAGTYNMSLSFQDPSVPEDARSRTENWKCAVRDPETEIYSTLPFTVTFNKHCKVGTGFATTDSTECTECPENTFSSHDKCEECEKGYISQAGSDKCWKKPNPGPEFYVLAGVGGALLVILALMIAALIWNKRRQEQQNVIIANPTSNENGNRLNVTVNIASNESKF